MNNKVLITINGLQHDIDDSGDGIETIQQGLYKMVAGKHVVTYEDLPETEDGSTPVPVKNILKITNDTVSLTKRGGAAAEMFFKNGYQHTGMYETPYGTLQMSMVTTRLNISQLEDSLDIDIDYGLEMNYKHLSDCTIHINIQSL